MPAKDDSAPMKTAGVLADSRENRRHERLNVDTSVKYKVIKRQTDAEKSLLSAFNPDGRSVNISLCGLAIVTEAALKKGEYLKLELSLPGRIQMIRALAEVMWATIEEGRNVSGIRFLILLNQTDDATIRRFIEEHSS